MTPNSAPDDVPLAIVDAVEDETGRPVVVAPADGRVFVRGWALAEGSQALASVEVAVGAARAANACTQLRPDVAAAKGSPERVGFHVELPLADAGLGHHAVTVTGARIDGTRVAIPVRGSLDILPPARQLPAGLAPVGVVGSIDEVAAERLEERRCDHTGIATVVLGATVMMRGWSAAPDGTPPALAYVEIGDGRFFRAQCGYPRPDVAAHFGTHGSGYGFRARIAAAELGLGEHRVRVHAVVGGGAGVLDAESRVAVLRDVPPAVYERGPSPRGQIDSMGRVDGRNAVVERREPLRLERDERLIVSGWAGNAIDGQLPSRIMIVVDGVLHGSVRRGIQRDDVARSTGSGPLRDSGFSALLHAGVLAPGYHRAELVALYGDEPLVFDAFSFEIVAGG